MAGKIRHFLEPDGRYYARLIIPKELRPFLDNKTELRTPLGGDYRAAVRIHASAVAGLQHKIAMAEQARGQQEGNAAHAHRYPLTVEQIASGLTLQGKCSSFVLEISTLSPRRAGIHKSVA
jgi:hypothetical protein